MRPETPSDPSPRTIEIGGLRLAYVDEGAGPCVLAIHGLPGSLRDFRWLASALGDRARLVRLDLPGFGASIGDPPREWSAIAEMVCDFAEQIVAAPYVVLGHSFGGPLATVIAAHSQSRSTARVCGIAWLAPVGLRPHRMIRGPVTLGRLGAIARLSRTRFVGRAVVHAWRRALLATGFPSSTTPADVARTLDVISAFDFAIHRDALARARVPAFAAWTEDDPFVEPRIVAELADASAGGPRLGFATGGHNLQKTQAVEIADALAPFARACVEAT